MNSFEYINHVYHKANIELFEAQINLQHTQYSILENYHEDSQLLYEGSLKDFSKNLIETIKRFFNNIIRAMERWIAKILSLFSSKLTNKINQAIDDYGFTVPELDLDEVISEFRNIIDNIKDGYNSGWKMLREPDTDGKIEAHENMRQYIISVINKLNDLKKKFNNSVPMDLNMERKQLNLYKAAIKGLRYAEDIATYSIEANLNKYGTNAYLIQFVRSVFFTNTKDFVNIIQRRAQIAAMSIIKAAKIAVRGSKANTIDIEKMKKIYDDANKSFSNIMEDTPNEFGL